MYIPKVLTDQVLGPSGRSVEHTHHFRGIRLTKGHGQPVWVGNTLGNSDVVGNSDVWYWDPHSLEWVSV